MDFAALMSKELSKTKKPSDTSTESDAATKYKKRADIEAERRAAYLAEQKAIEEERQARAAAKRKREEEAAAEKDAREEKRRRLAEESRKRREEEEWEAEQARRRRLGLPEKVRKTSQGADGDGVLEGGEDVPEEELVAKLRELGHPAVLFGEGHAARLRRYRKLTTVVTDGPIPTTLQPVKEEDMKVEGTVPKDKEGRKWLYRQLASYFTMVLIEYEKAMEAEKRDTAASRNAYNAMVQARENLRPVSSQTPSSSLSIYRKTQANHYDKYAQLYRKFERDDIANDLLSPITEIVKAIQERRYVDANDGYLRLSIGKAAWPIGVTMVGIHERSAREKLHKGEKGHVMGDEVTRKILQSIKRCLTFAQVRWPPTDMRQLMG